MSSLKTWCLVFPSTAVQEQAGVCWKHRNKHLNHVQVSCHSDIINVTVILSQPTPVIAREKAATLNPVWVLLVDNNLPTMAILESGKENYLCRRRRCINWAAPQGAVREQREYVKKTLLIAPLVFLKHKNIHSKFGSFFDKSKQIKLLRDFFFCVLFL